MWLRRGYEYTKIYMTLVRGVGWNASGMCDEHAARNL